MPSTHKQCKRRRNYPSPRFSAKAKRSIGRLSPWSKTPRRSNWEPKRVSGADFVSIHTAITRNMQRRYANGESARLRYTFPGLRCDGVAVRIYPRAPLQLTRGRAGSRRRWARAEMVTRQAMSLAGAGRLVAKRSEAAGWTNSRRPRRRMIFDIAAAHRGSNSRPEPFSTIFSADSAVRAGR